MRLNAIETDMNENKHLLVFEWEFLVHARHTSDITSYVYPDPNIHLSNHASIKSLPTFENTHCSPRASYRQETKSPISW